LTRHFHLTTVIAFATLAPTRNGSGRFYKVEFDPVAQLATSHAVHNAFGFTICRLLALYIAPVTLC
jgi:hypothetical protein